MTLEITEIMEYLNFDNGKGKVFTTLTHSPSG